LAVCAGDLVYTAGQVARDLKTGEYLPGGDIKAQTRKTLENIKAILEAANTSLDNIIKTTVYIVNWDDYAGMNEVYKEYFHDNFPARATVQVARLNHDLKIEIEAVAILPEKRRR
jgi:2-iminobutanoate/2-iminopropanoate deaminase